MKVKRILSIVLMLCLCAALLPIGLAVRAADITLDAPVVSIGNVASTGKIKLSWIAVSGADSYRVYRATSKSGTYTRVTTTDSTSYTNTATEAGKQYYYYVVAVSDSGALSEHSNIVTRTCDLPSPVLRVSNVASSGKIQLSWGAVSGAKSYQLYRSEDNKTWSLLKSTSGTSVTDTGAKQGKTYYYKVRALASVSAANSAYSAVKSRVCDLSQPVITLGNDASSGKIKISWTAVDGAVSYKLYRSVDNQNWSLLKAVTETSYLHTAAEAGTRYYYKVRAIASDTDANSAYSAVKYRVCDLPRPTVSLSNVASTGKIKLTWEAVSGAVKYKVYRSEDNQNWTLLKTLTGTSLTNTSTETGKTYYYKVMAIAENSAANSAYSSIKYRTCDLPRPVISLSNVASTGKIKLTWEAIEGASKYEVWRSTSENGTFTRLGTTTGTSYINTSAVAGTAYYYKVRAIHSTSAANSAYSSVKYRTCDLPRPTITLSNVASTGKIKISWTAVEGAVKYEIYRSLDNENWSYLASSTGTSATNTKTEAGIPYYYKVRAIAPVSAANSAYSSVKYRTCDLPRPTITLSNVASTGKIKISWTAVEGAVKYEIYRSLDNENWSYLASSTGTSATNTKTEAGVAYYYKVRAVAQTSAANSAFSPAKYRTCDLAKPVVTADSIKATSVTLSWGAVTGASRYEVYRSDTKEGTYTKVATVTGTSYQDKGLTRTTNYYYKVRAVSLVSAANSAYAGPISVKTAKAELPSAAVFMSGESEPNSTAVILVTNKSDSSLRFFSAGGKWLDAQYTDYDRDIILYDSDALAQDKLVELEYLDVKPGETAILAIVAESVTRYTEETTINLDMQCDGVTYTVQISGTNGFTYQEKG